VLRPGTLGDTGKLRSENAHPRAAGGREHATRVRWPAGGREHVPPAHTAPLPGA
jgi:hypothetical protein